MVAYLNAEPINAISERWIRNYERDRIDAIGDLKTALENRMSDTEFVYTTYIEAPPELVWRGLTDPSFTRRYWGMEFDTDWKVGSKISVLHTPYGVVVADDDMVVSISEPHTRLAFGWAPQVAELFGDEHAAKAATEARSTVSVVLPDIRGGWPKCCRG